jgi:hypothetical protein
LRVRGRVTWDILKPTPWIVTELIVNGAVPVAVTVTGNVTVDPTVTLPKLRLAELADRFTTPTAASELFAVCCVNADPESVAPGETCRILVAGSFVVLP